MRPVRLIAASALLAGMAALAPSVIPLAEGFDTAGPMTRSVADAAALLTAVAGTDPRDAATAAASAQATDYVKAIRGAALAGVRLGYSSGSFSGSSGKAKLYAQAVKDLQRLGATLVDTDTLDNGGLLGLTELALIPNDFKANLNRYLTTEIATPKSGVKSLSDIIAFNSKHPERVKYGQRLLQASDATPGEASTASAGSLTLRTTMGRDGHLVHGYGVERGQAAPDRGGVRSRHAPAGAADSGERGPHPPVLTSDPVD